MKVTKAGKSTNATTAAHGTRTAKATKASIIGATCVLVAAGAGTVGAANKDLDGNNRALSGSDIFKSLTNDLLSQFTWGHDNFVSPDGSIPAKHPGLGLDPATGGLTGLDGTYYTGGGQSVGDAALQANTQQIDVGTASLKNTNYATNAATGTAAGSIGWIDADDNATTNGLNTGAGAGGRELRIQGTTEALLIGLDGLSILGHSVQAGVQAGTNDALAVAGKALTVHHYVPSDARFFPSGGSGGSVVASTKTWTLPGVTFAAADVGGKIAIAGATNAGNNNTFTISSVTLPSTIVTVQAPVDETLSASVRATVFVSKLFVVNDADTTFPSSAWGAVGGVYTFNNSLDVIRLLYGGLHHDGPKNGSTDPEQGTFDAGSDVRRSLADNFGALFNGAVPSGTSAKLNHVWRRSDLAGATNAFIALVSFGARGIGALTGSSTKTSAFANSGDANGLNSVTGVPVQFQVNSTVKSNGGPGDFADFDPIRRVAQVGPNPATASTTPVDLEQVAENDGTLGLVLPIFPPDSLDGAAPTVDPTYASKFCTAGRFDLLSPGFVPTGPTGTAPAPQGGPFSGLIYLPYFLDTAVTPNVKHYNCIARSTNPHAFAAPTPADNRVFNLAVKSDVDGHYYKDLNGRFLSKLGYYRIHTTLSNALVSPAGTTAAVVTAKQLTADAQEGALIVAEPFSVSFNGRGADNNSSFAGNVSALKLSGQASLGAPGQFSPTNPVSPNVDQNIKNLVIPGATPVYPLARRIYAATLVGFTENPVWSREAIIRGGGADPGPTTFDPAAHAVVGGVDLGPNTAVRGLQGQEYLLARAFQNSDHVGALFRYWGFVPLPSSGEGYLTDSQGHPANGVTALDYPEDLATNTLPLNGANETGTPYASNLGLPGVSGTGVFHSSVSPFTATSGNNEDATVVSPPNNYSPYSSGGNVPPAFPFPFDGTQAPAAPVQFYPWPSAAAPGTVAAP